MEIFIKEVKIQKVRHLAEFSILLSDSNRKHLILTGRNGSGKTSLLEAIKAYLQIFPDGKYSGLLSDKFQLEALNIEKAKLEIDRGALNEENRNRLVKVNEIYFHLHSEPIENECHHGSWRRRRPVGLEKKERLKNYVYFP